MSQENAKELRRIVDLHHRRFAAREAIYEEKFKVHSQARDQFQHLQKYHESGVKEVAVERAELAACAAAIDAANGNSEQERPVQLRLMCAVSKRGFEETYSETLAKMHDERNSLTQQIGVLQLQLQQAHDRQAQLREHYSKEAQLHIDSVVASAAAREAARVSNIQTGSADFVLLQQLKQARQKLVGAQQEAENWKGASSYWADQAAQSEIAIETLARQLAEFGGRSGAERLTFSERCASQQRDISATYGLELASVSQAPSRAPISDTPKPAGRPAASGAHGHAADDELLKSPSSDDEDRKRRRTHLKALVLDPFPPNALGFRRWQLIFHSNICFASRHDSDSNMVWVQYVEMSGVTIADLGVSGKCWDDLDIALAEAVLKMVSGSLLKDILYYQDTRGKEHKLMPGRAALMYVYRKYALGAAGPLAVDLQTLMHLKFNGDLESFIHAWDACLLAIEAVPLPNFILSLLEPELRDCKQPSPAFAHLD